MLVELKITVTVYIYKKSGINILPGRCVIGTANLNFYGENIMNQHDCNKESKQKIPAVSEKCKTVAGSRPLDEG